MIVANKKPFRYILSFRRRDNLGKVVQQYYPVSSCTGMKGWGLAFGEGIDQPEHFIRLLGMDPMASIHYSFHLGVREQRRNDV